MTDSQYIGYKLLNDATVSGYVGTRIYFGNAPESIITYPYITYFLIGYSNNQTRRDRRHYQISIRDKNREQIKTIAYAIETLFETKQEAVSGLDVQLVYWDQTNMLTEDDDVYHIAIDIYIEFEPT